MVFVGRGDHQHVASDGHDNPGRQTMSVVNLWSGEPSSAEGNPDLVRQLEELIERAKSGQITAMGMAFVNADGSIATRWSGGDQTVPMIAAVAMLQHEFLSGVGGRE